MLNVGGVQHILMTRPRGIVISTALQCLLIVLYVAILIDRGVLMETIILYLIGLAFIVVFGCLFAIYRYLVSLDEYAVGMAKLLERTFEYYYKSENIKPQSINWGIDLVWNPDDKEDELKRGFITIYYGEDSGVDSPIEDLIEADIVSQKIIEVVDKHIHDKKLGVVK